MSFTAKYPGDCPLCGEEVRGTECAYNMADEVIHVLCPEDAGPDGVPLPVCPLCFCAMPLTGRCDCRD